MTIRLRQLLVEALRTLSVVPPTEAALQEWIMRIHAALEAEVPSDKETRNLLANVLNTIYKREIERGGVADKVPDVLRYTLDRIDPELRAELDRRIFAGADLIKINKQERMQQTLKRFAGWLSSVPVGGTSETDFRAVASEIMKPVAQIKFEARRVAIDQGAKLSAAVAHVVAQGEGAIAAIWHDRGEHDHGYDARPAHLARSGKLFLVRDSWAMKDGLIAKGAREYTDEIEQPAELPYCFPGETPIQWANGVEVGYRRWYSGELTEIITASGKTLRATPNHPILTPHGFVACGSLQECDDVIEIAKECVELPELANDQAVPTIAEIFGSLAVVSPRSEVSGGRDQFHGDGTESNVYIVRAARPLTFDVVTARSKCGDKLALSQANLSRAAVRAFNLLVETSLTAATRIMSAFGTRFAPLGPTLYDGEIRGSLKRANRPAYENDLTTKGASTYAEFGGERLNGLSGLVAETRIVSVKRLQWSGHVYNLQTADGVYSANGIIAHNCSCYYEYVTQPGRLPADVLTQRGREWTKGAA